MERTFPLREDWLEYTTCLTRSLEEVREAWFNDTVTNLSDISKEKGFSGLGDLARLEGDTSHVLRAFQLYLVSILIGGKEYLPLEDFDGFMDILDAQVCGSEYHECMDHLEILDGKASAEDGKRYITGMVLTCISGKPLSEYQTNLLGDMIQLLGALTLAIIADIFDDRETSREFLDRVDTIFGIGGAAE
jgi:hypothetical protein